MGSINISLKREAYEFLKALKNAEKSFSDVILEFREKKKGTTKDLMKYFGVMNNMNIDWEAKERRMKEFRDSFNKRIEETRKYMEKARREKRA